MWKMMLAAFIAFVGLTTVSFAEPDATWLVAKLTLDGECVGEASYTEKRIDEERFLQIFEIEYLGEPGEKVVIEVNGRVVAKAVADPDGKVYYGVKGIRKVKGGSEIPVAEKGCKVTAGKVVGVFESR